MSRLHQALEATACIALVAFACLCFFFAGQLSVDDHLGMVRAEDGSLVPFQYYAQDHYNSGYRAGKMDTLAQQVECYHMEDKQIKKMYQEVSQELKQYKELDTAPYPCEE